MSSTDEILYCPSLFGYSNYSIAGFRKNLVEFSSIPDGGFGKIGGILGGAGIGITKSCKNPEVAAKIIEIIASPKIQSTLYPFSGGQPGHRSAWLDSAVNKNTSNFYRNTLENLDNSYLRPTFPGFIELQTKSGDIFSEVIHGRSTPNDALDSVDQLYRDILRKWESFS
jgi:multiple sugar transport system substrate-binding protein